MRLLQHLLVLFPVALLSFAGCAVATPDVPLADDDEGETSAALVSCHTEQPGICAGRPINDAVECAKRHGAVVLSYYRSEAQQRCVRRQNGCTDECTGQAGCRVISANCGSSPHSRCESVDFAHDGAPATTAQLAACGLRKTTAPHANHYDYVGGGGGGGTTTPAPAPGGKGAPATPSTPAPTGKGGGGGGGGTCASATLGTSVADGACVQRADNSWYVCDGSNPTAWPAVSDASDPRCTSCPQLSGGQCNGGGGK
jgi:hypothetical protein